jgi:hypothetical protein
MELAMDDITMAVCVAGMGSGTYSPMGFFMANALQTKTYSTAGSFTFDPNTEAPGITAFTISAWGGGGAGGGSANAGGLFAAGGGAGGNYATRAVTLTGSQLNTSISITVGAAGTAATGAAGGAGGNSTVSHPNFTGVNAGGGGGGGTQSGGSPGIGGVSGATLSGTTTFREGAGGRGGQFGNNGGGGGGSSAGTGTVGNSGSTTTTATGGAGGTAPTGGVSGGAGGNHANGVGVAGTAGGGAGGGASTCTSGTIAGGVGGAGKVTISWTPAVFKRFSMSIFNATGVNNLDCSADSDNTSRFTYTTTPALTNGIRIGGRRANAGNAADMSFYVQNNAGSASAGPAVMSTTSFSPSPQFYFGASNSWSPGGGGTGNGPATFFAGYLSFAMIGPKLSTTQMQSLFTLISTYNTILGRTP